MSRRELVKPTTLQRIYVGVASGALMAGLTGAVSTIEGISDPVVGMAKPVVMAFIIPGLLGSAIIGGNIHTFSLGIAVAINGVVYSILGWLLYSLWIRRRKPWGN